MDDVTFGELVIAEQRARIFQLEAELAKLRDESQAKLARVESLLPRWREPCAYNLGGDECADELEAALRDAEST